MSNENGTLLARQVRRFIEKNPTHSALENVEESAKTIILELGNPAYYADESEEFEPIPLELSVKKSFEARYKKLQKEYESLPDLKKKVSRDEEKEKEDREKKEKEDREKKEKEDREKKEKEDREKKEKEDREKKEKEAREKKEKEDREKQDEQQMSQESNTDHLLDQLKSMDPDRLQGILQKAGIRGFRETTADTASSWNTRESSADPTDSASGYWQQVKKTFGEDTGYWLNKLSETSKENDCDFADIKFYLEYLLRKDADREVPVLGGLALEFIDNCPASQAQFVKELRDQDPQLNRAYNAYHASSRISGEKKPFFSERRPWARNPQAYRERAIGICPPELDDWDQITILIDPDTNKKSVKGRITASIKEYLDVCLDSLRDNDEERHILVKRTDYLKEAQRFEGTRRGRYLTLKPESRTNLKGRKKSDIKILNYTVAEQPFMSSSIKIFFVGIDKKDKNVIRAWTKTEFCAYANFKQGLIDVNEQRKACGQKELFRVPKLDVPWPHQDSNSDSESPFESDVEDLLVV
ncbi:hypothetical protein FJTKL_08834 [Diaporthe vaccinii]|uniref:Uncharacterized protein n=1 Tax=Diaporthe vaccinii TaxID=105482 RepID=A0ABR4EPS2_9PEZI